MGVKKRRSQFRRLVLEGLESRKVMDAGAYCMAVDTLHSVWADPPPTVELGVADPGEPRTLVGSLSRKPIEGEKREFTWSLLRDGTQIKGFSGESDSASDLVQMLDSIYGRGQGGNLMERNWFPLVAQAVESWATKSGVKIRYEAADDGAEVGFGKGIPGLRGDIRIGGHRIDGNRGKLGYSLGSIIVLDTADPLFRTAENKREYLFNTLVHEVGHSIGMSHSLPANGTKVMEPVISTHFVGIQPADTVFAQEIWDDQLAGNQSPESAVPLSNLMQMDSDDNQVLSWTNLSVVDGADDYFKTEAKRGTIVEVIPSTDRFAVNATEYEGRIQADLSLELLDSADSSVVLKRSNAQPNGGSERLTIPSSGTFVIRVSARGDGRQHYSLRVLAPEPYSGQESTYVVNNAEDSPDADLSDGLARDANGQTSLRAAVEQANATPGLDTIEIPAGMEVYASQSLIVTNDLIIQGADRNKSAITGRFDIRSGKVTLSDLAIRGAYFDGDGGIFRVASELVLNHILVADGNANNGGALFIEIGATASINDTILRDNLARQHTGGAIHNNGHLMVSNSQFRNNAVPFSSIGGGAIFGGYDSTLMVDTTSFVENKSENYGGAIMTGAGSYSKLSNVVLSGNVSEREGAGAFLNGQTEITNSTITNNESVNFDYSYSAGVIVNSGGLTLKNSIVAGNVAKRSNPDISGNVVSLGGNVIGVGFTGTVPGPNDLVGSTNAPIDPKLGPLDYNGNGQPVHLLLAGSPAIDRGVGENTLTTDIRGGSRFLGESVDSGAVEFHSTRDVKKTILVTTTDDGGPGSLREAVEKANARKRETNSDDPMFIQLPEGRFNLVHGELVVESNVIIVGADMSGSVLDALGLSRHFYVTNFGNLGLQDLSLVKGKAADGGSIRTENGNVSTLHVAFSGNHATEIGGAVRLNGGKAVFDQTTFEHNSAGELGGAVYTIHSDVRIEGSRFLENSGRHVGGLSLMNSVVSIRNSEFERNEAIDGSGALLFQEGMLEVLDSIFRLNRGGYGGAAGIGNGHTKFHRTRFIDNEAQFAGGAIRFAGDPYLYTSGIPIPRSDTGFAVWEFVDGELAQNNAGYGGAITQGNGLLTIRGSSLHGNQAATIASALYSAGETIVIGSSIVGNAPSDHVFAVVATEAPLKVRGSHIDSYSGNVVFENAPANPSASIRDSVGYERRVGTSSMSFEVVLSAPSVERVSITASTLSRSAYAGNDFIPVFNEIVIFEPGETKKLLHVRVIGDRIVEGVEEFEVRLGDAHGVDLADELANGKIIDDPDADFDTSIDTGGDGLAGGGILVTLGNALLEIVGVRIPNSNSTQANISSNGSSIHLPSSFATTPSAMLVSTNSGSVLVAVPDVAENESDFRGNIYGSDFAIVRSGVPHYSEPWQKTIYVETGNTLVATNNDVVIVAEEGSTVELQSSGATLFQEPGVTVIGNVASSRFLVPKVQLDYVDYGTSSVPEPHDDSYSLLASEVLRVEKANGLLANDLGTDQGRVRVHIVSLPKYGRLEAGIDGSFTYFANPGFTGTDTFSYLNVVEDNVSSVSNVMISVFSGIQLAMAGDYEEKSFALHNPLYPFDVNGDSTVSPLDVLVVINALNSQSSGVNLLETMMVFPDVDRDGSVTPLDVLQIVNELNSPGRNQTGLRNLVFCGT